MIDPKLYTFLELCSVLNYHKVAENLNITQPAVTQHIQYLENYYQCKLFTYSNRKLSKTAKGIELEKYARTVVSLSLSIEKKLLQDHKYPINIGATKTIGDYLLNSTISTLVSMEEYELNFLIDNTKNLISRLDHFELDLLLLEGYVDKSNHMYQKISDEEIIGICSTSHPFANREIALEEIFQENIVLRENGSGTRNVFESFLRGQGYSINNLEQKSIISSNKLLESMVEKNLAISFVYDVIQKQNPNIARFRIAGKKMMHEFNFVYMDRAKVEEIMELIEANMAFR